MTTRDERKSIDNEVDSLLEQLKLEVTKQLLEKVREGEDLRAAIDWLKTNKRSVTEERILGSDKNPTDYLDSLIEDLGTQMKDRRRT